MVEIVKKAIAEDIVPEVVAGVLMNVDAAHSATGLEVQIVCQQNLSIFLINKLIIKLNHLNSKLTYKLIYSRIDSFID